MNYGHTLLSTQRDLHAYPKAARHFFACILIICLIHSPLLFSSFPALILSDGVLLSKWPWRKNSKPFDFLPSLKFPSFPNLPFLFLPSFLSFHSPTFLFSFQFLFLLFFYFLYLLHFSSLHLLPPFSLSMLVARYVSGRHLLTRCHINIAGEPLLWSHTCTHSRTQTHKLTNDVRSCIITAQRVFTPQMTTNWWDHYCDAEKYTNCTCVCWLLLKAVVIVIVCTLLSPFP